MPARIWRGVACDQLTFAPLYGFVADSDAIMFFPAGGYRMAEVAELQSREFALGHSGMPGEARAKAFLESEDVIVRHEGPETSVDDAILFVQQRLRDAVPAGHEVPAIRGVDGSDDVADEPADLRPGSRLYVTAFLAAHLSICLKRRRIDSLAFGRYYIQWAPGGPGLQVEAVSDRYLEPEEQITAFGAARMRELGFATPTDDDPNWTMWLDSEVNAMSVAEPIVTALVEVYRVPLEDVAAAVGAFPQPPLAQPLDVQEPVTDPSPRLDADHGDDGAGHAQDGIYLVWETEHRYPQLAATVVIRLSPDRQTLPLVEVFPETSRTGYKYLFESWGRASSLSDAGSGEQVRLMRAEEISTELRDARTRFKTDIDLADEHSPIMYSIADPTAYTVTVHHRRDPLEDLVDDLRRWVPTDTEWARWGSPQSSDGGHGSDSDATGPAASPGGPEVPWWDQAFDTAYRVWDHTGHPERPELAATVFVSFPSGHRSLPRVEVIPELSPAGFAYLHVAWVGIATDALIADSETIRVGLCRSAVVLLRDWRSQARDASRHDRSAVEGLVYRIAIATLHTVNEMDSTVRFDEIVPQRLRTRPTPGRWSRMIAAELVDYCILGRHRNQNTDPAATGITDEGRQRVLDEIRQRQGSSPNLAAAVQARLDQLDNEATPAPFSVADSDVPLTPDHGAPTGLTALDSPDEGEGQEMNDGESSEPIVRRQSAVYLVWDMDDPYPVLAATVIVHLPVDRRAQPDVIVRPEPSHAGYRFLFQPWRLAWSEGDTPSGVAAQFARGAEIAAEVLRVRALLHSRVEARDETAHLALCIADPTIYTVALRSRWVDGYDPIPELHKWVPRDSEWSRWADAGIGPSPEPESSESGTGSGRETTRWWDDSLDTVYRVLQPPTADDPLVAEVMVSFPPGYRALPRVEVLPAVSPIGFSYLHGTGTHAATDAMVAASEDMRRRFNLQVAVLLRDWRTRSQAENWDAATALERLVFALGQPALHMVDEVPTAVSFDELASQRLRSRPTPGQWTRMIAADLVDASVNDQIAERTEDRTARPIDTDGSQRVRDEIKLREISSPKIAAAMRARLDLQLAEPSPDDVLATSDWISVVELAPETNGVDGGPWRLTVTRTTGETHWWPWVEDENAPHLMSIFRSRTGEVVQIQLSYDGPFQDAALEYGLDHYVFGSRTLWPATHFEHDSFNGGWVWTHSNRSDPFPFASRPGSGTLGGTDE